MMLRQDIADMFINAAERLVGGERVGNKRKQRTNVEEDTDDKVIGDPRMYAIESRTRKPQGVPDVC